MRQCRNGREIRDSVTNCVMKSEQDESFIERRWLKGEEVLEGKGKRRGEGKQGAIYRSKRMEIIGVWECISYVVYMRIPSMRGASDLYHNRNIRYVGYLIMDYHSGMSVSRLQKVTKSLALRSNTIVTPHNNSREQCRGIKGPGSDAKRP